MRGQDTLGSPASFSRPAVWGRSSTREGIAQEYGIFWYQTRRRIPPAWSKVREWSPGAMIATLPSVIQTGVGPSGPTRTMLPQLLRPKRHASSIAGESTFALDSEYSGQAQPPLAEQPQRTKEEPYHSQPLPILNLIRLRLRGS